MQLGRSFKLATPITPGRMPQCHTEYDGEFAFLHPLSTCNLSGCSHFKICETWMQRSILPKANSILAVLGLDWVLPGHGEKYGDCGDWRYRGCLNVGEHVQTSLVDADVVGKAYVEWYHRSCYRAECPVCFENWAAKEAGKIDYKLNYYIEHGFWKKGKVCHFTVSPDESTVLRLPFEKLRAKMYEIAKKRGILGGSAIWHPFRENDDGTWRFSPHFHILGFGWLRNVAELYEEDGWLVKKIDDGNEERNVFKTAMYQLSHCGISVHGKFRSISWFGICSTSGKNRLVVPPLEKEKHLCPICETELIQLRFFGNPDLLPDKEEGASAWLAPEWFVERDDRFG